MNSFDHPPSDPLSPTRRMLHMLTHVPPQPKSAACLPMLRWRTTAAALHHVGKIDRVTRPTPPGRVVRDRLTWAAEMSAIRDDRDQQAFAALFGHFAPRIKGFLMRSGAAPDLAEECAQEVMATLWHKAHMFDATKASVATWIFSIARNRLIDKIRKQRRPEPQDLPWGPEGEPDPADALALAEDTEKLAQALATLPDKQRNLIERAYFGDLSHSEIAAETGLPLGTIKSRIRLALDRLRHAMN